MTCGSSDTRNAKYQKAFQSDYDIIKQFIPGNRPIVFDVGAHRGETIREVCARFRSPIVHAFEPDPDAFRELRRTFAGRNGISLNNIGIGSSERVSVFYRNELSHTNSFLKVNERSRDHIAFASGKVTGDTFNQKISAGMTTIDHYCKRRKIQRIDLLKIDTQGYEVECLRGSLVMLERTRVVKCELSLFDYYVKSTSFFDVERILRKFGFALYAIPFVSQNPSNGRTDWVEALYTRPSE